MENLNLNLMTFPNPLTKNEFVNLFYQMKNGDDLAKEKLVLHNLRLVMVVLKKYIGFNISFDELFSVGNLGLIKALNTYDINRNIEFSTYAIKCINNEFLVYLNREKKNLNNISFDDNLKTFKDGNYITYRNILKSDINIILDYEDKIIYDIICEIINLLPERKRICLLMYYGLNGYEKIPQKDIARQLNTCQSRVSTLLDETIDIIRKELVKREILESSRIKRKSLN